MCVWGGGALPPINLLGACDSFGFCRFVEFYLTGTEFCLTLMPVSVVSLGYTVKDDAVTPLVVRMSNMNSA